MPLYRIHITSSDGAIDSLDEQGIELTGVGEARALGVETLLEAAKERVPAGLKRTTRVTVCDEGGAVVYGDELLRFGAQPDEATAHVWRAMTALNRAQHDPRPTGVHEALFS